MHVIILIMTSFYVFLPSSADPHGSPAQYTVTLPNPIEGIGSGEVALVEMLCILHSASASPAGIGCRVRTNITQPCIDGNMLNPVIRAYTFPSGDMSGVYQEEFDQAYYFPLSTGYIPAITVQFELDSPTIRLVYCYAVLHFHGINMS